MTIPRRTDIANDERQGIAVLAELPHVGPKTSQQSAIAPQENTAALRTRSNHPAFAELNEFADESMPVREPLRSRRYVDQPHMDPQWETGDDCEYYQRRGLQGRGTSQRRPVAERHSIGRHRRAAGMGQILSGAHEHLAPFAGLIVTAALMASAGLLFLKMVGSKSDGTELNELALPGFSVEADGQLSPVDTPLVDSEFSPEAFEPEGLEYEPPQVPEKESIPLGMAPADTNAAIPQPVIEEINEPLEPLGQISFPVTSTPLALDLSKAFAPTEEELKELPTVAERESPTASEPINR